MVRLLFEASTEDGLHTEALQMVNRVIGDVNGWTAYKIGRQASRYGHHAVAADIFSNLSTTVCWFNFLDISFVVQSCDHRTTSSNWLRFFIFIAPVEKLFHM